MPRGTEKWGTRLDLVLALQFMQPRGVWRVMLIFVLGVGLLVLVARGIVPSLQSPDGDFANYYTASRLLGEGTSLEPAYRSFPWFQQQIDRFGISGQVGGLIPHPPAVALVMLPLSGLEPLDAKRIWIGLNAGLVLLNIWLLGRISRISLSVTALLFLATGYGLLNNFLLGQLYLVLQTTILLSIFFFQIDRPILSGLSLGLLIPVKYFGGLMLLYFAWKRQWAIVASTLLVGAAVFAAGAFLDPGATRTFSSQVVFHHLSGQIQDPYAVAFQSWNSLFRRLFIAEPDLNPVPFAHLPLLFPLLKNLVIWTIGGIALFAIARSRIDPPDDEALTQLGLISMAGLLLSPGGATYHFLLLTPAVIFVFAVLVRSGRPRPALAIAALWGLVNLPHYIWLRPLEQRLGTPLLYSRLWLLLLLFLAVIVVFRRRLAPLRTGSTALAVGCLAGFAATTVRDTWSIANQLHDDPNRIEIAASAFTRNFGLILDAPALGSRRLVFSYCELLENRYRIFSLEGGPMTSEIGKNQYEPSLAGDDRSLLFVTVERGRFGVWHSTNPAREPEFVVEGRSPDWSPSGESFAFERDGSIFLYALSKRKETLLVAAKGGSQPRFLSTGDRVVYVLNNGVDDSLVLHHLQTSQEKVLGRFSRIDGMDCSADSRWAVLCAEGRIIAIGLDGQPESELGPEGLHAVSPVWDEGNRRIVYLSDSGRGLACRTLFFLPLAGRLP